MRNKIVKAYQEFFINDRYLLEVKANERSLTHRLAIHVQTEFPGYHVDCEYNRNGMDPKRLGDFKRQIDSDDEKGVTVYPDIIVHHRGPGAGKNLIVIEAKTSENHQECQQNHQCPCDHCKLRAYKAELGYQYAFFITFPFGDDLVNYTVAKLADYIIEI